MAALLPHLRVVELPQETVLYERDDTIKAVYFPHEGVISLVVDLASGDMIEAAMVGRDSVAGGSSAFDNQISLNRAVVQITGRASALNVDHFRALAAQSNTFRAKSRATNISSWRDIRCPANPGNATASATGALRAQSQQSAVY
jgi:CRP-like cAMP-binding protein